LTRAPLAAQCWATFSGSADKLTGAGRSGVCRGARWTNIYLSDIQQAALDAKAAAEGSTRSEVLRALVDRELNLDNQGSEEVDAALADLAAEFAEQGRRIGEDDADLSTSV